MQNASVSGLTRLGLTLAAVMLLTSCAPGIPATSETEATLCRELARDLPTYSTRDTPETLESGVRFLDVFKAVCG